MNPHPLDVPPPPWGLFGPNAPSEDYSFAVDRTGGIPVATVSSKVATPSSFATVTQGILADKYRGCRVRFSGDTQLASVAGRAWLWMRVDSADGRVLAFDNMQNRPLTGDASWSRHDVVLDVPELAVRIYFGFALSGTGAFSVMALAFEVVDPSVSVTGFTEALAKEPQNLDFSQA